jgi:hypothetical protein
LLFELLRGGRVGVARKSAKFGRRRKLLEGANDGTTCDIGRVSLAEARERSKEGGECAGEEKEDGTRRKTGKSTYLVDR